MAEQRRPYVAIYRDSWLAPSEGFVIESALHFRRYRPIAVGLSEEAPFHPLLESVPRSILGNSVSARKVDRYRLGGFPAGFWRQRLGPDVAIVHAHFGPDAIIARHIARDLEVPFVATLHGYDVTVRDRGLLRSAQGRSYLAGRRAIKRGAARLLPVSDFLHAEMLAKGWPSERTVTHYLGIDTNFWSPNGSELGHDVVFVGRLIELKGADAAIHSFAQLCAEFPESRLHIVGYGPEEARLVAMAASLPNVVFHGGASRDQIRALFAQSRVVVAPSRLVDGRREALNLVAVQAAACGLPVVAYDSGGLREAVERDVTGLLVAEDDAEALTNALRRVLADTELAAALGRAGRELAETRFSIARQSDILESHYDEAIREFQQSKR